MSARRRITRGRAERLLRRAASGSPGDPDPLVRLLAAAAAPPRRAEAEDGEEAALAAFRVASRGPAPAPGRRTVRPVLVRLLATKAAVAVLATTAGGIALAAGAANLSDLRHDRLPKPGTSATAESSTASRPTPSTPNATGGPVSSGPPSPSQAELCRAYRAIGPHRQRALVRPTFAPLVAVAGGRHEVARYCADLLRGPKGGKPEKTAKVKPGKSGDAPGSTRAPNPNATRAKGRSARPRLDRF
jgi:hypothetical protein